MLNTWFQEFSSPQRSGTTRDIWSDVWKMRVKLQPCFLELENLYRARGATEASGCCHLSVGSPGWRGVASGPAGSPPSASHTPGPGVFSSLMKNISFICRI